jgi:hypothetical protein
MQMRKLGLFAVIFSVLASLITIWYLTSFSMSEARSFTIGNDDAAQKLLIVYQGSAYKNSIIENVVEHFSPANIIIEGVDISALSTLDPSNYNAIFILHTWEFGGPPSEVSSFLADYSELNHVVRMTTSHSLSTPPRYIDAITTESILTESEGNANEAIIRLELLID